MPEVNPHQHKITIILSTESADVDWCSLCGKAWVIKQNGDLFTYEVGNLKPIPSKQRLKPCASKERP
jgi:hypothetical protein